MALFRGARLLVTIASSSTGSGAGQGNNSVAVLEGRTVAVFASTPVIDPVAVANVQFARRAKSPDRELDEARRMGREVGVVQASLRRTGTIRRFNADHHYGRDAWGPKGCAEIIEGLAQRIDAREYNAC